MDITTLTLLGRLIFDVVRWINDDTNEAENNRELPKGAKHEHVKQLINNKIDNYDIRAEHKILPLEAIANAKLEAKKHIDRHIIEVVDIKNRTGEFYKE